MPRTRITNIKSVDTYRVVSVSQGQVLHGKGSDPLSPRFEVLRLEEQHDPRSPVVIGGHLRVEPQHLRSSAHNSGRVRQIRQARIKHGVHRISVETFGKVKTKDEGWTRRAI